MADHRTAVLRTDEAEAELARPMLLASMPVVGLTADSEGGLATADPSPMVAGDSSHAGLGGVRAPAEGRVYYRIDDGLAGVPSQGEPHPQRPEKTPSVRPANAGAIVAAVLLASVGMIYWMVYGPGSPRLDLPGSDSMLVGTSPEVLSGGIENAESPAIPNAIQVQPSHEVSPPAGEPDTNPVSRLSPVPEVIAAPPLMDEVVVDEPIEDIEPAVVATAEAMPPHASVPEAAEEKEAEAAPAPKGTLVGVRPVTEPSGHQVEDSKPSYISTAHNLIDNGAIDFSQFRPMTPRPQRVDTAARQPLFRP